MTYLLGDTVEPPIKSNLNKLRKIKPCGLCDAGLWDAQNEMFVKNQRTEKGEIKENWKQRKKSPFCLGRTKGGLPGGGGI